MITTVLIVTLLSSGVECSRHGDRCRDGSNRSKNGLAWFEAFPPSGAGLPSAADLCGALTSSEKVGDWWCFRGDGTSSAGGRAITLLGSEVLTGGRLCPNGPDCATVPWVRYDSTTTYSTSANYNPTSRSFTACFWGRVGVNSDTVVTGDWVTSNPTAGNWYINGQGRFGVINTSGSAILVGTASSLLPSEVHLLCGTVDSAGNPAAFVDGVKSTAGAATVRATPAANTTLQIGYSSPFVNNTPTVLGAFATNTRLSDARIAQLARLVLADAPTGARGETLTFTRSSSQFCESSDSTGTMLPANRLCVGRGGTTAAQSLYTEYLLRTEELDNAVWNVASGGSPAPALPVRTANVAVSPAGTLAAERVDFDATSGTGYGVVYQSFTGTAAPWTASCYLRGVNGNGSTYLMLTSSGTYHTQLCSFSSTAVTRCSVTGTLSTATWFIQLGVDLRDSTQTAKPATPVYAWGCNVTNTATLRPYVSATSSAVTTAAEVPYFTLTDAPVLASVEAQFDAPASYATNQRVWSVWKDANNIHDAFVNTGGGNLLGCFYFVGGVSYTGNSAVAVTPSASHRLSCSYTGTHVVACVDGACNSTALSFTLFAGATRLYVGAYSLSTGYEASPRPTLRAIRADPSPTKFR